MVTKTISKKKKRKKVNGCLSWPYKYLRREEKGRGERERYTKLNEEFQRIARRSNKAFLNEQCKEIEGNNRMGKTRDLFKKTEVIKETFHAKMSTINKGQK